MKPLKLLLFTCLMSFVFGCKKEEVSPVIEKPKVFYSEFTFISKESPIVIREPLITQELLRTGIILVYYDSYPVGNNYNQILPVSNSRGDFYAISNSGTISIYYPKVGSPPNNLTGGFRYVIIPKGAI
jgi:hypothetical protein